MLFFRSVCLVASAAFVAFTSASPLQESGVNSVTQPLNTDAAPRSHLVSRVASLDDVTIAEARETSQSLNNIFSTAKSQFNGLQELYKSPKVDDIGPCIQKVQGILAVVLIDTRSLQGKSIDYILGGCTIPELANLLYVVLTLIVNILLSLMKCAGSQNDIYATGVQAISGVLCELLTLVFHLVSSLELLSLLIGLLGGITGFNDCGLGGVLIVVKALISI
ncbi:hypothetical protein J132_09957 [Termitomyces sp. J132]|nr:hypothetical protein H2248_003436 [Termitomyces sp. 'cryptogamus']KNZ76535.1 hypothetical protein J132_09957 [Termitomyces sp. J132]